MKIISLDVLFSPADFAALSHTELSNSICVVFDVLRATSSMITALVNGAQAIIPVEDIAGALKLRDQQPALLLAGERDGFRIGPGLTGGIAFDLGNSPREFQREVVEGKTIVMTTTNGTRALCACRNARRVLLSSFLNLKATFHSLEKEEEPFELLLVCGGTFAQTALEDSLCAGALCELVWKYMSPDRLSDSALMAHKLYETEKHDLLAAISRSRNGRRLLDYPQLKDDVAFCARLDAFPHSAQLGKDNVVRLQIL